MDAVPVEPIEEKIRAAFQYAIENPKDEREEGDIYRLDFTIDKKPYTTHLSIKSAISDYNTSLIIFINGTGNHKCLEIVLSNPLSNNAGSKPDWGTMIRANSKEQRCFEPPLISNRNSNPPITSADVLQVLKTKLQYLMPETMLIPITLKDAAVKDNVPITLFNVLRGKDPYYKRYGYVYPKSVRFLEVLPTIQWKTIKGETANPTETFEQAIKSILNKEFLDETPLLDIMKQISFHDESVYNAKMHQFGKFREDLRLSEAVATTICNKYNLPKFYDSIDAVHNPTSPEWIASSARLQFVLFEKQSKGGRRRQKRKTSKQKKQKKRTRRLKKALKA